MERIFGFMQSLNSSSNAMAAGDYNTPIADAEMHSYGETDVAEEAAECGQQVDDDDGDENGPMEKIINCSVKESAVDNVDCVRGSNFQNEHDAERVRDHRSPEIQPPTQADGVTSSRQGVVQSVDEIVRDFEKAVSTGNWEKSTAVLSLLVKQRAKLKVQILSIGSSDNDRPFIINVNVETNKVATGPKWKMQVTSSMTIFALKTKTCLLYGLPFPNQRWIMGRKIPLDTETLLDNGIRDNAEVFLYVTPPRGGDSRPDENPLVNRFHQQLMLKGIGNDELSFTQAEYNKYLKEKKLRQVSSRTCQKENGPRMRTNQPTNTQPPVQGPFAWNTRQDNNVQLAVESTETRGAFHNPDDTNGLQRSFMGGDFDRNQMKAETSSEIPLITATHQTDGSFPPPHLVQRGPPVSGIKKERQQLPQNQLRLQNMFDIRPQPFARNSPRRSEKRSKKSKQVLQKMPVDQLERCRPVGQLAGLRQTDEDMVLRSHDLNYPKRSSDGMDRFQSLNLGDDFMRGHDGNRQRLSKSQVIRPADLLIPASDRRGEDTHNRFNFGGQKMKIPPFQAAKQSPPFEPFGGPQVHPPVVGFSRRPHRGSPVLACQYEDDQYITPPRRHSLPSALDVGWACPSCTVINPPQIPGCRVCLKDRPAEYRIPDYGSYIMDEGEARHIEELEKNEQKLVEMQETEEQKQKTLAVHNRMQLVRAAEDNLTTNEEPFECPICFSEIEPDEGVRLQECLHEICRDCCANHINISNEAEVLCPYTDGENDCNQAITDREILQIVGQAKYDEYKMRSLKSAEAKAANTFHCLTPNCEGFCFYDEEHNFFDCPICRRMSCLTCKVIHEGQNCREYQDDIRRKAVNDETARQTQEQLQRLLQQGMAMNCPQCGVVIQKKGGCPNMTCSVCRRGFRWTGVDM